ncbi:MAG TPA: processed acidic surface protein [Anoxybacillus sp.]|nr:processed acidic surface protein [Anoxybacillus sp.]
MEESYSTPITEEALTAYLQEQNMTKEQLIALLEKHGESLEDFTYIEELADTVEYYQNLTPLTEENLNEFLQTIGLTRQQLEALLEKNDDSLANYTTVEELTQAVMFYMIPDFSELGLTDEELEKLFTHFEQLNVEDPQFVNKMEEIGKRLDAISLYDFEGVKELSAKQIAEITGVMQDMLHLFQLDVKFYLTKNVRIKSVKCELSTPTIERSSFQNPRRL